MEPYTAWQYFYPPRPNSEAQFGDAVMEAWLSFSDTVAQFKLNGTRNMVVVHPDRTVKFWNRHAEEQKYEIPAAMREKILAFTPADHFTILDTELLDKKTVEVKNTLYCFDVLVWESKHLIGRPYSYRYELLRSTVGDHHIPLISEGTMMDKGAALGQSEIYVAENFPPADWKRAWDMAQSYSFVEGLVLKRTGGISRLEPGLQKINNSSWLCRVRKPTKNFRK